MVLTGLREMEMRDVPDPQIVNDTDVLIRMAEIGVCGSDIHYYTTGRIGSQVVEYPFPVGHEGAGIVEAVGAGVTRVKPGDRIAIEPAMPCWNCVQCKAGRPHTCLALRFLGCPGQAEGCMTELLVMPETSCFPIADSMSLSQAALSEPLSIGVYSVKLAPLSMKGAKVGILGVGPIGLSVLLPALAQGAAEVYVTDKLEERLGVARKAGASWGGNPDTEDVVGIIKDAEAEHLDVVFECCGQQDALDQGVEMLKPGGTLMVVGIPEVPRISFDVDTVRRHEICIQHVRRQCECVQPTLDMIERKEMNVDFMMTHRYSFAESKEAFDLVADYKDGVVKAMIDFDVN